MLENKEIIILGYFNEDLLNFYINITSFGFSQLITEPTRATNNSKTIIDHICKARGKTLECFRKKLGISDHFAIAYNRKINFSQGLKLT